MKNKSSLPQQTRVALANSTNECLPVLASEIGFFRDAYCLLKPRNHRCWTLAFRDDATEAEYAAFCSSEIGNQLHNVLVCLLAFLPLLFISTDSSWRADALKLCSNSVYIFVTGIRLTMIIAALSVARRVKTVKIGFTILTAVFVISILLCASPVLQYTRLALRTVGLPSSENLDEPLIFINVLTHVLLGLGVVSASIPASAPFAFLSLSTLLAYSVVYYSFMILMERRGTDASVEGAGSYHLLSDALYLKTPFCSPSFCTLTLVALSLLNYYMEFVFRVSFPYFPVRGSEKLLNENESRSSSDKTTFDVLITKLNILKQRFTMNREVRSTVDLVVETLSMEADSLFEPRILKDAAEGDSATLQIRYVK
jgi:hypothetical protein